MAKDKGGAEEEQDKLGRYLLQILAQEDTLKALEQKDFASQETLALILLQLDITLSALRDALRGAGDRNFTTLETDAEAILARLNVNLSTRASQTTLAAILTQLDITLSSFRDALRGASTKNFTTLESDVENVYTKLNTQLNITISALRDAIRGASTKDFTTLETELAKKVNRATTPPIYNVTMTNADTEYPQALPANTKKFLIHTRDGTAFRLAFVTGKVAGPTAPYFTIPTDVPYWEDFIEPSSLTLYFACGSAGKVVEIICWS